MKLFFLASLKDWKGCPSNIAHNIAIKRSFHEVKIWGYRPANCGSSTVSSTFIIAAVSPTYSTINLSFL